MKPLSPDLLVIIPAYNEETNVAHVVAGVHEHAPGADVVVIDDGSHDRTAERARQAGAKVIRHTYNMGYGAALQTGYKYARDNGFAFLSQIDADGQHDPCFIPPMVDMLRRNEADVVIGSRFLINNGYRAPFAKRLGMLIFGRIASWTLKRPLTDPTSGFQALSRRAFCYCCQDVYPSDFADADVLIMLHRAGLRICEYPVRMYPSVNKKSRYLNMYAFATPLYYLFKMSLTMMVTLLRERGGIERGVDG